MIILDGISIDSWMFRTLLKLETSMCVRKRGQRASSKLGVDGRDDTTWKMGKIVTFMGSLMPNIS
jgi:hypothetical protein